MARAIKVDEFQAMQRGTSAADLLEIDPAAEDAAATERLRGIGAGALNGHGQAEPMAEQLQRLQLQDDIAGMPLGQVVGLVRLAAAERRVTATETEIRDEAERRIAAAALNGANIDGIGPDTGGGPNPDYDPIADRLEPYSTDADAVERAGRFESRRCAQCAGHLRSTKGDGETICDHCEERAQAKSDNAPLFTVAASMSENVEPTMADAMTRLVEREMPLLNVGAECSEEMSLGMVIERVREAVLKTDWGKLATDAEIVAEGERIWEGFSVNRKGPRVATVEADGTVRDWRRPDTTPDRGPDVGTTTHTITDDEPRFSGGGDGQAQQASLFLVPSDSAFGGRDFTESGALFQLAQDLIEKHGILDHLAHCQIRYFWRRKTGVSKGQRITGGLERASGLKGHLLGGDFAIWIAADTARERQATDRRVERWLFRQLRRIGQDDKGNWIELPFTLQVFTEEITHYADVGDEDLRVGHSAFRNADQMGLFADNADGPVDDGSGVLIWPDGTAMTAEEVAAQEAAEIGDNGFDDEASEGDEPADPDAEFDDEPEV